MFDFVLLTLVICPHPLIRDMRQLPNKRIHIRGTFPKFSKSAAARRIAVMHRTYCPPPTSGRSGWFRVLGQGVSRGGMPLNIGLEDTLNLFSAAYQGERAD